MVEWLEGWERNPQSDSGPLNANAPRCLLLHTMETSSFTGGMATLTANGSWPQLAYDPRTRRKVQAISLTRAGKALANIKGGVETNRWGPIQVEIPGYAVETQDWPDEWLRNIAEDIVVPLHLELGVALWAPPFVGREAGFIARADAPQRFGFTDWLHFDGVCGHQHAPENDHWDPGHLNVPRILEHAHALVGSPTHVPRAQETDMLPVVNKDTNQGVLLKDGAIVRSLGLRVFGVFGTITDGKFTADQYANALVATYGLVELPQALFETLPLATPDMTWAKTAAALRSVVAWVAAMWPRKSAKTPPPEIG